MNNLNIQEKLDRVLLRVEKPARYIGGEPNTILKDVSAPENADMLRFAFCFPDKYEIGMSFLGMQILYFALNKKDKIFCERVFSPDIDMAFEMEKKNLPLFTLETKTAVSDMDMVGFTLQYELSYTNVLLMMKQAGIPLRRADRSEKDPLIVVGGPCAFNCEPLADFIDLAIIGDGEHAQIEAAELAQIRKANGWSKEEYLKKACEIPGVYVPGFYEPIWQDGNEAEGTSDKNDDADKNFDKIAISYLGKRFAGFDKLYDKAPDRVLKRIESDLDSLDFPTKCIIPLMDAVYDRSTVEIFRGCTRGCRFCQAGMLYRPVRERSKEKIMELAKAQLESSGHGELSLLSLSSSDYSDFEHLALDLMGYCQQKKVALSLPSLRMDNFGFKVMDEISGVRKTALTFAIEAGSQRLRNVINKNVTEDDIFKSLGTAMDLGWTSVKLYLMIGLPTETDEDLDAMVDLCRRIMELARSKGKRNFTVNMSVSNFVPKPFTPFQWVAQNTPEEFTRKHYYIKDQVKKLKGVTMHYAGSFESQLEAVFARGGRELSKTLELAVENGCCFDGWSEHFNEEGWKKALLDSGIDESYYALSGIEVGSKLPWSVIDPGIYEGYLELEYDRATNGETTPDCRISCNGCGLNRFTQCKMCGSVKPGEEKAGLY